jgi:hypothetical protein
MNGKEESTRAERKHNAAQHQKSIHYKVLLKAIGSLK